MATAIPKVEQLSARVIRVLGCNPGSMTLQGTNSYIIGTGARRILIDTSNKDREEYIQNLKTTLKKHNASIQEIIVTHWHHDHLDAVPEVCDIEGQIPVVSKFKRISAVDEDLGAKLKYNFVDDQHVFKTEGATLKAVYTPGHTDDHMALYLEEEQAVFSADAVLGEGTTVFEDLYTYMKSLDKLLSLKPSKIYPGHGPVISNPIEKVTEYIAHRHQRENQIMAVLLEHKNQAFTPLELVKIIYVETPEHLHVMAAKNISHHLSKLLKENKVCNDSSSDKWYIQDHPAL